MSLVFYTHNLLQRRREADGDNGSSSFQRQCDSGLLTGSFPPIDILDSPRLPQYVFFHGRKNMYSTVRVIQSVSHRSIDRKRSAVSMLKYSMLYNLI